MAEKPVSIKYLVHPTGTLADISDHLMALVCGNELSGIIMTVSRDFRLAKWNLQNGSLVWSKRLPWQGEVIHDIASVYYDQAILLVQQSRVGHGYGISVIYTGEGHSKIMSRDNVTSYWISVDRTHVMLMCQDPGLPPETTLYAWDLISTKEEMCQHQPNLQPKEGKQSFISFSPSLKSSVCLVTLWDERPATQLKWSYKDTYFKSEEFDSNLATDQDFDTPKTDSDTWQNSTDSRFNISTSKMYQSDSLLEADQMQNFSDSLSAVQECPNLKLGSAGNASPFDITESTGIFHEQPNLHGIKTLIRWTKVCVDSFRSRGAKEKSREIISDQTTLKLSDKSKAESGGKASPTFCDHGGNDKIHHKTVSDLKSMASGKMQEDIDMEKNQILTEVNHSEVIINMHVTSVCFVGEQDLLLGTSSRHLLMLHLPALHPIYVLGRDGLKLCNEVTEMYLTNVSTPHKKAITYIRTSDDLKVLISSDQHVVCLWETHNWTLTMKIEFSIDQKISHMAISKDAVIVAMVTNNRIIHLWTPVERREVTNYKTTFDITELQMTSDCHKVVVRGIRPENEQTLEVFDILNIDDILMHVDTRKELQQQERRELLTNERKTSRQQTKNWQKSPALNVIDESA